MIYSVGSLIWGIVFIALAILSLVFLIKDEDWRYVFLILFLVFCSIMTTKTAFERPEPELEDLMEGRARVVETMTITEEDTVRTYKMVWNDEGSR